MFTRRRVLVSGIVGIAMCLVAWAWELWWTPERIFRSCAAAGSIGGIKVLGFHSESGKDVDYRWQLKHERKVRPQILASLPFHPCDQGDTDWLQRTFADEFKIEERKLKKHLAYRGGTGLKAEYILVAPDGTESFYLFLHL